MLNDSSQSKHNDRQLPSRRVKGFLPQEFPIEESLWSMTHLTDIQLPAEQKERVQTTFGTDTHKYTLQT